MTLENLQSQQLNKRSRLFRILYITANLPFGPGEAFFIPEVNELRRQGHEVLIVPRSPRGSVVNADAAQFPAFSVRQSVLSTAVLIGALAEALRHPGRALASLALLRHSRGWRMLLKNLAVYPKGLWLARLARRWGADHIHTHWASTTATMALVASEVSRIPWSFTAHRWDIPDNNLLSLKVERDAFSRFISQSGMAMAAYAGVSGLEQRSCIIHMGVDLPKSPSAVASDSSPRIILCPANLIPVKGHRYLLKALALLKARGITCNLHIAGQGELRPSLEQQCVELDVSDLVTFLGQVPHEMLLRRYTAGEVAMVVLPSVDLGNGEHEGIPVALIEAMGYGIPVISTTTGGIPELLHDAAGVLVPPADPEALANALQQVLQDEGLRTRLSVAGRRRVEEEFAVQHTVSQLVARIQQASGTEHGDRPELQCRRYNTDYISSRCQ